jgi:hypothetical protein
MVPAIAKRITRWQAAETIGKMTTKCAADETAGEPYRKRVRMATLERGSHNLSLANPHFHRGLPDSLWLLRGQSVGLWISLAAHRD